MKGLRLASALALALTAGPAHAHTGAGAGGFAAGLAHPLLGLDHLVAMVAVGVWAGLIGARALWAWPAAFIGVMVLGAALALEGIALPSAEAGIAASAILLGVTVAGRLRLPVAAGAASCGLFALFHGYAHGAELPAAAAAMPYVAGFCLATALLHGLGVGFALASSRLGRAWLPRAAGGIVAASGVLLLAA